MEWRASFPCMRPQILGFAGMSLKDFATTEEALGVADAMIKENQDKFGVKPIIEESQYPLLQKHYYVNHLGVKTSVKEGEKRHLQGERDVGRAFKKQMLTYETESEKAVEGVAAAQRVKVESESFEKLQHALNDLKSDFLRLDCSLHALPAEFAVSPTGFPIEAVRCAPRILGPPVQVVGLGRAPICLLFRRRGRTSPLYGVPVCKYIYIYKNRAILISRMYRSVTAAMTKRSTDMRQLKFQMAAQQKEDASLKDKTAGVSKMAQELSHFVDECMTKHASASILKVDHDEKKLE